MTAPSSPLLHVSAFLILYCSSTTLEYSALKRKLCTVKEKEGSLTCTSNLHKFNTDYKYLYLLKRKACTMQHGCIYALVHVLSCTVVQAGLARPGEPYPVPGKNPDAGQKSGQFGGGGVSCSLEGMTIIYCIYKCTPEILPLLIDSFCNTWARDKSPQGISHRSDAD